MRAGRSGPHGEPTSTCRARSTNASPYPGRSTPGRSSPVVHASGRVSEPAPRHGRRCSRRSRRSLLVVEGNAPGEERGGVFAQLGSLDTIWSVYSTSSLGRVAGFRPDSLPSPAACGDLLAAPLPVRTAQGRCIVNAGRGVHRAPTFRSCQWAHGSQRGTSARTASRWHQTLYGMRSHASQYPVHQHRLPVARTSGFAAPMVSSCSCGRSVPPLPIHSDSASRYSSEIDHAPQNSLPAVSIYGAKSYGWRLQIGRAEADPATVRIAGEATAKKRLDSLPPHGVTCRTSRAFGMDRAGQHWGRDFQVSPTVPRQGSAGALGHPALKRERRPGCLDSIPTHRKFRMKKYSTESQRKNARLESRRRYRRNHRLEENARANDYYHRNRSNLRIKAAARYHATRYYLVDKYGITKAQYDAMLVAQNNCCFICGQVPPPKTKRLCVDHDHNTGQIRRLICDRCNRLIGLSGENSLVLKSAAGYVDTFKPWWHEKEAS